jgi:hypothetical protein
MDDHATARVLFEVGGILFILGGALHAGLTLFDDLRRPTYFSPTRDEVREAMDGSALRFRGLFAGGDAERPTMWKAWLGFNTSHGLGMTVFGVLCLLLAIDNFDFVRETDWLIPLALAVSAAYLGLALRFWFYGPTLLFSITSICFAVALALA